MFLSHHLARFTNLVAKRTQDETQTESKKGQNPKQNTSEKRYIGTSLQSSPSLSYQCTI